MWFKDDIRNILLGLDIANGHPIAYASDSEMEAYRAGFRAAIIASAASFGILISDSEFRSSLRASSPRLLEESRQDRIRR